jgi:hypothetical protein
MYCTATVFVLHGFPYFVELQSKIQFVNVEVSNTKTVSFKDPPPRRENVSSKDLNYKVPSGKEGSLKHRILTRPSDSTPESSVVDVHYGEPSAKRTRYDPQIVRSNERLCVRSSFK